MGARISSSYKGIIPTQMGECVWEEGGEIERGEKEGRKLSNKTYKLVS